MKLLSLDIKLLRAIQNNARISNADLVEKIVSSKTVYWNRTKALVKMVILKHLNLFNTKSHL